MIRKSLSSEQSGPFSDINTGAILLYSRRDIMALDREDGHFSRHMSAMTAERLHDKADIAAELAYRDARISRLQAQVQELEEALAAERDALRSENERMQESLRKCYTYAQLHVDGDDINVVLLEISRESSAALAKPEGGA